jgi:UDP-GlcNAc:undecaprenyl-phosphate GlcNAc-1-phosphate transferase
LKGSTPRVKLLIQILIGIIIITTGNGISAFNSNWINYPMTLFWAVSLMNSINMLDNMDAITASVSGVIIASLIAIGIYDIGSLSFYTFTSIGILISLIVFLKWNWNPSKMYMGDNGSQFLGAFLAFIGIKVLWNNKISNIFEFPIQEIIAVALSFITMISDTATVTINRLRAGKSPFIGGKDHTTHNLSYLGLSDRKIAITFIAISIIANGLAFLVICIDKNLTVFKSILWLIVIFSIFAGLYSTTIFAKKKNNN